MILWYLSWGQKPVTKSNKEKVTRGIVSVTRISDFQKQRLFGDKI